MFASITLAVRQFFNMITVLFGAGEKMANTVDNVFTITEAATGNYADVLAIQRKVARFEAIAEAKAKAKALGMTVDVNGEIQDVPVKAVKAIAA